MTGTVLLDVAVILLVARAVGAAFAALRQPRVIGELVAGVMLGPSLLGFVPGNPSASLFPSAAVGDLQVIGQIGLVAFMFTVGWDLDLTALRRHVRVAGTVSVVSVALPFALGLALATALYPQHRGAATGAGFWPFALFIGASLSITAFPVLARILEETGLGATRPGVTALGAAAVDDVLGWTIVAIVLALLASGGVWAYARVFLETVAFAVIMIRVVRPVIGWLSRRPSTIVQAPAMICSIVLAAVMLSSYITQDIGIHAVFGAFLLGAVMPRPGTAGYLGAWRAGLTPVITFLLPIYFVVSGLAVDVRHISLADVGYFALILVAAVAGKFGGAFTAARIEGLPRKEAATVAVLMNTRGLIEIVLLTVGLQRGIIDRSVFTLLVLMALMTTLVAAPVLRMLQPHASHTRAADAARGAVVADRRPVAP